MMRKFASVLVLGAGLITAPLIASAEEFDDGQIVTMRAALAGKRVGYIPLSMGTDMGQIWYEALKRDADRFGYEIITRDANWGVEAGAQAINELIGEGVDVLVLHPADNQAFVRLVDKANRAGIPVIQVNMKSPNTGGAYVGPNWYAHAQEMASTMHSLCATQNGGNGKIALIPGPMTSPATFIMHQGLMDYFEANPGLEIVADQPADYDSNKAKAVAATVAKQTPDVCGIIGFWDTADLGTFSALQEAGIADKVHIVTSGSGEVRPGCNNVANGTFDAVVSYESARVGMALSQEVMSMLQNPPEDPSTQSVGIYIPSKVLTEANADTCWDLEKIQKNGF